MMDTAVTATAAAGVIRVATKAFPHPLACMNYHTNKWCGQNYASYTCVERLLWLPLEMHVNHFRASIGLQPVRWGDSGYDMLNNNKVSQLISQPHYY